MTLHELLVLLKKYAIWVVSISLLSGVISYFYVAPKNKKVKLKIETFPNQSYKSEIMSFASSVHYLFDIQKNSKSSKYKEIDEFLNQYDMIYVSYSKSSRDSVKVNFNIAFKDLGYNYEEVSNDFISLINKIILKHSSMSYLLSGEERLPLEPLYSNKPYIDITKSRVNPLKGASIVFFLSLVFCTLFLALISDLKKHRSSSTQ